MVWLAWIIFAAVVLAILILNTIIVRYFKHKQNSEFLPTLVAIISLTLTLLCIALLPVDIYSVSQPALLDELAVGIKVLYYVFYGAIVIFALIIIPFAYFWYEALDHEEEKQGCGRRLFNTCKFAIVFIIVMVIFIVTGLVVSTASDFNAAGADFQDWVEHVLHLQDQNRGEGALLFTIACTTMIGYICWMAFGAYGLSALPLGLLKGKKSVREERKDFESQRGRNENKRRLLDNDAEDDTIARSDRSIQTRMERLEKTASNCCSKCLSCMRPVEIIFGIVFLLLSLLVIVSIILGAVDRIAHSYCGASCGFIMTNPMLFNPIDTLLVVASPIFPLDFICIGILTMYIYFAALQGITGIGIRFFCIKLYSFRKGATAPQGLLIGCGLMMLSVLALNMQMLMIAPQYSNWGAQKVNETIPCSYEYVQTGECKMTQIGEIQSKILLHGTFFGFVFYWVSWAFILFWIIGLIVAGCQAKRSNIEQYSDDDLEDEN